MVSQDRYGLFRPTADQDGKTVHEEWKTFANVHMDVSTTIYSCRSILGILDKHRYMLLHMILHVYPISKIYVTMLQAV